MTTDDRAQAIIDGAFRVLMAEGLPHLSYKRVAEACGTTRQLVRYHYPEPDDLMLALCDRIAGVYRESLMEGMGDRVGEDRIKLFLDFYFDLLEAPRKPRDDQVYDALMALAARSGPIRANLRQQYTLLGQVVSHELRQQYQEIPFAACEQLAFLFVSVMYGHWKMVASLGMHEDHRHITRQGLDRLIDSYRRDPQMAPGTNTWKAAD